MSGTGDSLADLHRPHGTEGEDGCKWNAFQGMWQTQEQWDDFYEHKRKFKEIVGDQQDIDNLNKYEKGMGL